MDKRRKIDFILHEDEWARVIFRFYPRQSSCHSFGDKPPKSWNDVYKVYYSYKVIKQYKDNKYRSHILFDSHVDESSAIDEVAAACDLITMGHKNITKTWNNEEITIELLNREMKPFGMGVFWKISEIKTIVFDEDSYFSEEDKYEINYDVQMFRWDNVGYRFCLDKNKLREFGEYLNECCEYMLTHGDPI